MADSFADKLRGVVADVATVVRPQKRTTLIVSEVDESVTAEEITAKVAEIGGCGTEDIRAGSMGTGRGGMGTLRLQVPTVAAKKVLDAGRLLVGWVSASVRAVEVGPLRCFRCLCTGHTRPMCPSDADRTGLCYRCGKEGHKAKGCQAPPSCVVCAESGLPAGHVMRGAKCNPPPKRGKRPAAATPAEATSVAGDRPMSP